MVSVIIAFLSTVESQKDFHVKRLAELGLLVTTTTTQRPTPRTTTTTTLATTTHAAVRIIVKERERLLTQAPPPEIVMTFGSRNTWNFDYWTFFSRFSTVQPSKKLKTKSKQTTLITARIITFPTSLLITTIKKKMVSFTAESPLKCSKWKWQRILWPQRQSRWQQFQSVSGKNLTARYVVVGTDFNCCNFSLRLLSLGYCVVQRPHTVDTQYIAEGKSRRVKFDNLTTLPYIWSCFFNLTSFTTWTIKSAVSCVPAALILSLYHAMLSAYHSFHVERLWLIIVMRRQHIKHSEDGVYVILVVLFACGHRQASTR